MSTLDVRRLYSDGEALFEADLDAIIDDIETFVNTTKLNDDNIQTAGITGSTKLVDGSVTAAKLGSDSVTTAKILDANVTTAKLADSSVTTAKILDANVTTAKIADLAVTGAKIAAGTIEESNLNGGIVTSTKIGTGAVTTAKIADANVTTDKLANGSVTQAKKDTVPTVATTSSGSFTHNTTSFATITDLTTNFTTTGRQCVIALLPASATTPGQVIMASGTGELRIRRDSSVIAVFPISASGSPASAYWVTDAPAAGTYSYSVQVRVVSGATVSVTECFVRIYEL